MFKPLNFTRAFSSSLPATKEWKNVVKRRVAKRPEYQVGDAKPKYIPHRQTTPDYKYGDSAFFVKSNRGLYGGAFVRSGNTISEMGNKSRRFWKPNAHKKSIWSETLGKSLSFYVTAKVLKTIDKEGGLDNYVIKDKSARIKELGPFGWKLRYEVLKKRAQLENPVHKNVKSVTLADGKEGTVYYPAVQVKGSEKPLDVVVGRRRLLKELYETEKAHKLELKEKIDGKQFQNENRDLPAEKIIEKLASLNYNFSQIAL
ncbi:CYFA0S04e04280g1_1 [Cyberlindnera fabianii]|uniref:Large ribosomal subunit protein bL28m n=1 Tax=Cyberlindnera fabianii TaxID=36022 RepID=A0A061AZF7_CYBFA|nr:CYFA0S04e04280g1_1 [Cyberlindnera fabianii]